MSLRARLITTLLVLAAAGMLVLAAITYYTQRSFQLDRIDEQVSAAGPAMDRRLDELGYYPPGYDASTFDNSRIDPDHDHGGGPPGGPGLGATLPPGTYGVRRDAAGRTIGDTSICCASLPKPELPSRLTVGEVKTVDAVSGGTKYRVRAFANPRSPGLTVVAVPLNGVKATLDRLLVVEALVIAGVLLLLGALSFVLVRIGLRPLDRIGATAGAIAAGDLSRRVDVASPRTEVGRLGLALNGMLGRLERAFAEREASESRLRQFLSDASHELRTPLASIRGYAELFRIGAARSDEDVSKAMRRIEDEAQRMGVLVEDLLTLARLDETRETVREDVDVAELAHDAGADAQAMAPDRDVEVVTDGEAVVHGDPHQLRQVLANLVRNALVHTPAGTPIEIFARHRAGRVELEVRDHGPGLPTEHPDELFERFWRAERGRERGRAGAGLGLAIVAGIVQAHGGEVHATNVRDGGASFVVQLPLAAAREPVAR